MDRTEILLFFIAPVLYLIFFLYKFIEGIVIAGPAFNLVRFFFVDNFDFSMASALFLANFFLAVIEYRRRTKPDFSGAWNLFETVTKWKNMENVNLQGTGTMYLTKSKETKDRFIGNIFLTYRDIQNNDEVFRGAYEVRFDTVKDEIVGESTLQVAVKVNQKYFPPEDPDFEYSPCILNLRYDPKKGWITGKGTMKKGPSEGEFRLERP